MALSAQNKAFTSDSMTSKLPHAPMNTPVVGGPSTLTTPEVSGKNHNSLFYLINSVILRKVPSSGVHMLAENNFQINICSF